MPCVDTLLAVCTILCGYCLTVIVLLLVTLQGVYLCTLDFVMITFIAYGVANLEGTIHQPGCLPEKGQAF